VNIAFRICVMCLISLLPTNAFAQIALNARIGKSYHVFMSFGDEEWYHPDYWRSGLNVGLLCDYYLSDSFALSTGIEVARYPFDSFRPGFMIPEDHIAASQSDARYETRFHFGVKSIAGLTETFRPFLTTGFAYVIEPSAQVNVTTIRYYNTPPEIWESRLTIDKRFYWAYELGLGAQSILWRDFGISVSVNHFSNFKDRGHSTIDFGVVYLIRPSPDAE
jgi:hypothetical protein